jgi:hypothetical protein
VPATRFVGAARELAAQLAQLRYRLVDGLQRVLAGRHGFRLELQRLAGVASHPDGRVDRQGVRCSAQARGHGGGGHRPASSSSRVRVTREPRPDSAVILIAGEVKDGQDGGRAVAGGHPVKPDDELDEVRGTACQDNPDSAGGREVVHRVIHPSQNHVKNGLTLS